MHGWLTARALYRTTDGGKHWQVLPFTCGFNQTIVRVAFVNSTTGFLLCRVENGPFPLTLYRSNDGGGSWRKVSIVDPMAHDYGAFDFISSSTGFVSAGFANLLQTNDGGHHFHLVQDTPFDSVWAASWLNSHSGYVVGTGVLERTRDSGKHWGQVYPRPVPNGPIALTASGAGLGAGSGWFQDAVLRTANGTRWRYVRRVFSAAQPDAASIDRLVRTSDGTVWAVAQRAVPSGFRVYVLCSGSDGREWHRVLSLPAGSGFLSFPTPKTGFVATTSPFRFYVTHDCGKTWARHREPVRLGNFQFVSRTSGWALGAGPTLLHTRDGGAHWRTERIPSTVITGNLYFVNHDDGWVSGTHCTGQHTCPPVLLRTRDGGAHWTLIRFREGFYLDGLDWVSPALGYVLEGSTLYRTEDGGVTWREIRG